MYLIEGNVGAGKSTLLSLLSQQLPSVQVVFEAVNSWDKIDHGTSLLAHFYQDTPRWSYTMETYTMFKRIQEHLREQTNHNPFRIIERSLYSGHYCFARNGYLHGFLNETEWILYNKWFSFLVEQHCKNPHGFIYLQTDPKICYERAKKRSRSSEETIPLTYFKQIHEQHEDFLIKKRGILPTLKDIPVLVLDVSAEFETDTKFMQELADRVQDFILLTSSR
jgi:deoxyguanosine kinase